MNMDKKAQQRIEELEAEVSALEDELEDAYHALNEMGEQLKSALGQLKMLRADRRYEVA